MKEKRSFLMALCLLVIIATISPAWVSAQQFHYTQYGDVLAGFRKPGVGTYELVVNIGNITNFEGLPQGTTIDINNYNSVQLSNAFSDGFAGLSWSVASAFNGLAAWAGFPTTTIWYTSPRTDLGTRTTPPTRYGVNAQANVRQLVLGLGSGAATISTQLGTSNASNTPYLVREPAWDGVSQFRNELTWWITWYGNAANPGYSLPQTVENITPSTFTTAQISDLYRSRPTGYLDPQTGLSDGPAYYVGYFTFKPDGTMSFTRASTSTVPAVPVISGTRAGSTTTISFATTAGATYSLFYTDAAGLSSPVSSWTSSPSTVSGDGTEKSLVDTTTDAIRFYRVMAR